MTPDDEKRLKEIVERLEAVEYKHPWVDDAETPPQGKYFLYYPCNYTDPGDIPPADIKFIAHSHADIPWLIEKVRELEKEVVRLDAHLEDILEDDYAPYFQSEEAKKVERALEYDD